ncbi:MAG: ATP-binding protein [Thermoplasmata archaeon]|nr:ATP-binding protein [Thermoplasmata archaeon]
MKRDTFIEIIKDFEEKELPDLIERDIEITRPTVKKALVFIGPRRAGKTYFLFNIMKNLLGEGIGRDRLMYLNLEDDRLLPLSLTDLDKFLRTYYEIHPENKKNEIHLFLDEVQNVDGWETFVRRVMDTENIQVYITGSSSRLLSREIATSMRGRALSYTILPFSFLEYLKAHGFHREKYMSSSRKAKMLSHLSNYIKFGGFPEVVIENDDTIKLRILQEYVEVMLVRDVIERYGIKNVNVLKSLYGGLISSTSSTFSTHKFYNYLKSRGVSTSKNTLYEYTKHLKDVYAIILLGSFDYSLRKVQQSLAKPYPIDPGLLFIRSFRFSRDLGNSIEAIVAIELFRMRSQNPQLEISYWKNNNQKEVDFVVKEGTEVQSLIQVCYDVDDYKTKEREIKSLIKASDESGCDNLLILTWDKEASESIKGKQIAYLPLWKWLTNADS